MQLVSSSEISWILLRFPLFPRHGSPHQQPTAFLLILPPLDFSAVLCSGCNCIWATSAQRTYAGVTLAGLKVKGSSREAQWGHSYDFSVWKTGPSLWVQTSPRLCSGPLKYKYELCDYLLVNYIFIYPLISHQLHWIWSSWCTFEVHLYSMLVLFVLFAFTALLSSGLWSGYFYKTALIVAKMVTKRQVYKPRKLRKM